MLESWLNDPTGHAAAVDDPDLLGGPFMDVPVERTSEVRAFAQWTQTTLAQPLALANAMDETWQLLRDKANGGSLAELYAALPLALQGLTELVYTPDGAPDIRPLEGLRCSGTCAASPNSAGHLARGAGH